MLTDLSSVQIYYVLWTECMDQSASCCAPPLPFGCRGTQSTITEATTGLFYQPQMVDNDECGAVSWMIGRWNWSTERKPVPVPLCPPQIAHDLTWARTRAAAVGSRWLTSWTTAQPQSLCLLSIKPLSYSEGGTVMTVCRNWFWHMLQLLPITYLTANCWWNPLIWSTLLCGMWCQVVCLRVKCKPSVGRTVCM
jgi:hypothetical protein